MLMPFRGLRYAPSLGPDLSAVVCPPYDVISTTMVETLLARSPANAVRLELPSPEPGGADDTRYRAAARTLAAWRADGVLVTERQPSIYVHEMRWSARGPRAAGHARGVFARLRLEPFGPGSGVRPHERTMSGPKEDRFRLLEATGVNLSPVILLADASPSTTELLDRSTDRAPDLVATTDDAVTHSVWVVPVVLDADGRASGDGAGILASMGAAPLTIADGHHRYETALRYRDARASGGTDMGGAPWAGVMALVCDVREAPPVLPTHRVLCTGPSGDRLLECIRDLVDVELVDDPRAVIGRMATPIEPGTDATGTGRIGLVSGARAAILTVRSEAFDEAQARGASDATQSRSASDATQSRSASDASRGLDVNRLAVMLERLGVDATALAAGGRVTYVKDATEAVGLAVDGGAVAAFLLDGPPVTAVTRVAAEGGVMPQKSTFFDPKAPTGLVFGPLDE